MPTIEDNWSLVVPEAMSCGLPVATSIYNGCHEELIENGGNGYIFDTFNHEEFAEVLAKFHNVDLVKMGNRSVELEKPYNIDNCTQRVYDALNKYSINIFKGIFMQHIKIYTTTQCPFCTNAKKLLTEHKDQLDKLANELIAKETLDDREVRELLGFEQIGEKNTDIIS